MPTLGYLGLLWYFLLARFEKAGSLHMTSVWKSSHAIMPGALVHEVFSFPKPRNPTPLNPNPMSPMEPLLIMASVSQSCLDLEVLRLQQDLLVPQHLRPTIVIYVCRGWKDESSSIAIRLTDLQCINISQCHAIPKPETT